jgi:hypothetical protein
MDTDVVSCRPRPLPGRVPAAKGNLAYTSAKGRNSIWNVKFERRFIIFFNQCFSIHVCSCVAIHVFQSMFLNPCLSMCLNPRFSIQTLSIRVSTRTTPPQ